MNKNFTPAKSLQASSVEQSDNHKLNNNFLITPDFDSEPDVHTLQNIMSYAAAYFVKNTPSGTIEIVNN